MKSSIRDRSLRLDRPRERRRLRRLAMTDYVTATRYGICRASDEALEALHDALPDVSLMVLQMTSRRAAA